MAKIYSSSVSTSGNLMVTGTLSTRNNNRTYTVYQVFYRKNGEKRFRFLNTKPEVTNFRNKLKQQNRKFLGYRPITLTEVN
jgi:hypothetical protein